MLCGRDAISKGALCDLPATSTDFCFIFQFCLCQAVLFLDGSSLEESALIQELCRPYLKLLVAAQHIRSSLARLDDMVHTLIMISLIYTTFPVMSFWAACCR